MVSRADQIEQHRARVRRRELRREGQVLANMLTVLDAQPRPYTLKAHETREVTEARLSAIIAELEALNKLSP